MPSIVLEYFESFVLNEDKSTDQRRCMVINLSNGKVLEDVWFQVPALGTPADVHDFLEILRDGGLPDPITRAIHIVESMMAAVTQFLPRPNIPTVSITFLSFSRV